MTNMKNNLFHLANLAEERAKSCGNATVLRKRSDESGKWLPVTWQYFSECVDRAACAMLADHVGVQENMAIFTQNMLKGIVTDYAAFSVRAVTIPLYATSSEHQVQYIVNDAKVRILFVGEQQQYDVAFRAMPLCPSLEKIIVFDKNVKLKSNDHTSEYYKFWVHDKITPERMARIKELRAQAKEDDIANILYTSGTTGEPKGVMLTHANYLAQFKEHIRILPQLSMKNQVSMNFLPLTHVFERAWTFLCMEAGIEVCINTNPKVITQSIKEVHPTMMCSVPRFWEKVYDGINAKIAGMPAALQSMANDAIRVGKSYFIEYKAKGKTPPIGLTLKYKMYEKTIFQVLKKAIGIDKGVLFPTAGAAVPNAVEEMIHACGIPMVVGYGLTESTATVSADYKDQFSVGSAGRPLPSLQVKIGENNEVLIKGPSITPGYYKKPEANKEAFDEEGFFHTGDAGYLKDGELFLTDRIKDLFKTSNGKYIAPQMLEGRLTVDKYIDQIAVIADMRKFVTALIIPAYDELKEYAQANNIAYADMRDLCTNKKVNQFVLERIETLQQGLAGYEKVKRITLLPEPFSMAKGELTNTLKIRRPILLQNYATEIEKMYAE